jgi:hypothetical protein
VRETLKSRTIKVTSGHLYNKEKQHRRFYAAPRQQRAPANYKRLAKSSPVWRRRPLFRTETILHYVCWLPDGRTTFDMLCCEREAQNKNTLGTYDQGARSKNRKLPLSNWRSAAMDNSLLLLCYVGE